jgi:hypothetical protein
MKSLNSTNYLIIRGKEKFSTIILQSPNSDVLEELEKSIQIAFRILYKLTQDDFKVQHSNIHLKGR